MSSELIEIITIIASLIIIWLLFTWFLKVFQASMKTALTIAIILVCLQIFLGIRYQQVWQELNKLVQGIIMKFIN